MTDVPATALRPPRPEEAPLLEAWRAHPTSPFDDFGPVADPGPEDLRLARPEGLAELLVVDGHDRPIGTVQWHPVHYGPTAGSVAMNIGISLQPEARGQGHGARAQRQLAERLLAELPTQRVEASTDVENLAEQRALERAGFRREGVLRGAQWRRGRRHDLVVYSRLPGDAGADVHRGGGAPPA